MKINYFIKFQIIVLTTVFIRPVIADELGRLFTTPEERIQIQKLRNKKPEPKVVETEKIEEILATETKEPEVIKRDSIIVKGLVHRDDGKNTAWINESNTFEGDLESQYIDVKTNNIGKDNVKIIMPDDSTIVELKVGESYEPMQQ